MLTSLRLRNFRCFEGVLIDIGPAFNLFLGANGEGKTTILEAACILLRLQSQRSSSLVPVTQIGRKFFEVRGRFEEHELEFRYSALRRRVMRSSREHCVNICASAAWFHWRIQTSNWCAGDEKRGVVTWISWARKSTEVIARLCGLTNARCAR